MKYPTYKLGDICELLNGFAFKSSNYVQSGLRVIRITNVKKGYVIDEEPQFYPLETQEELKKYILKKGDLLISLTGNVGRVGILSEDLLPAALNQRVGCLRVKDKSLVSLQYLFHLLNTNSFEKDCINSSKGIAQKNMSTEWLKEYEITLPPLPTQHAIVTRIETLFAELDKAVQHLRTAQQQLKTYRQAVLNHWLNNDDGKWEMVKLGEVAEMCLGKMLDKNKNKGTYQPYLRNVNVRWGGFDLDDLLEMKFEESEQDRYGIRKGDLIMCEGGEPGRCAIWNSDIPNMKIQKALHRIRLNDNVLNKYVYFLFVLYAQNGVLGKYFTGTTIKHLTGQSLKSVEIPLPPLAEQQRIVKEIESRLSQATASETYIENALQQAEALRQSILKKAFSGELV